MNRRQYQKELDSILEKIDASGKTPRLLLHCCCAPCASYVLEYLTKYFDIVLFFYNPNITDEDEYRRRFSELLRLAECTPAVGSVSVLEGRRDTEKFLEMSRGLEDIPEGGKRCEECFKLRLSEASRVACEENCDMFATTLTISPMKNAALINSIGEDVQESLGAAYLASDFKKKDGFKRSVELSEKYGLYRQNYCGCEFSKRESERRHKEHE